MSPSPPSADQREDRTEGGTAGSSSSRSEALDAAPRGAALVNPSPGGGGIRRSTNTVDQSFPKAIRIRRTSDYRRVQGRGKKIRTRHLIIIYLRSRRSTRYGLTVSKKVGKAVTRNRVKRRLREAIRLNRGSLRGRWDVVFIATPRAAGATYHQLEADVKKGLRRINEAAERSRR